MIKIYKYDLPSRGEKIINMPPHQLLQVGAQGPQIVLWAMVQVDSDDLRPRIFQIHFTGDELPETEEGYEMYYHGTAQASNGLVSHVFEKVKSSDIHDR